MLALKVIVFILILQVNKSTSTGYYNPKNNACPTWSQYDHRTWIPKCRYNRDGDRTLEEIVKRQNYPVKAHKLSTRDNYVLTIFRINKNNGPSVLLLHGIYQNAIVWTMQSRNSLPFVLADAGYDVWLGNVRGTAYSSHTVHRDDSKEFWDFTPHEMGTIDIPAILEYIYNKNGNRKIQVIAFSMGTTNMLIYSSMMPKHAKKYVANQILLAPVATLNNLQSPIQFTPSFWNRFGTGLEASNQYYILRPTPASKEAAVRSFTPTTADVSKYWRMIGVVFGYSCQFNPDTFSAYIKNGSNAIGVSVLNFYDNIMKKGVFVAYNYKNASLNRKHYGTSKPPIYPLGQIRIPTSLVYGENDQVATAENVASIYGQLSTPSTCVVRVSLMGFQHTDFFNGVDAKNILYQPLVKGVLKGSCKNESSYTCIHNDFE